MRWTYRIGFDPIYLTWFYLHLTNYVSGMIGVHPVGNSVVICFNVGCGPVESGAKLVLARWQILENKPALAIRLGG